MRPVRILAALAVLLPVRLAFAEHRTENVVVIVTDGLRWQEVFRGAEPALLNETPGGVEDVAATKAAFGQATPEARRQALLPFFWSVVAREGQIYGNSDAGSSARVVNRFKFSYPGYNEIITGAADPRIDSNSYGPNPNVSVFEWMNRQPGFQGRVAVVAGWDAFERIFNRQRSGLAMQIGWEAPVPHPATPRQELLDTMYATITREFSDMPWDALLQQTLLETVRATRPHLLFVGYGETDEWAHNGRYDLVLQSARSVDGFIRELWTTMQAMDQYRNKTTFILTTDHGRGSGPENWKHHDVDVEGAEDMWIAVLGPDTPPLGERRNVARVTQSQIAATAAALLGKDWPAASPGAGAPIAEAIGGARNETGASPGWLLRETATGAAALDAGAPLAGDLPPVRIERRHASSSVGERAATRAAPTTGGPSS